MKQLSTIIYRGQHALQKHENPLNHVYNEFNSLIKHHNMYTINQIIKRANYIKEYSNSYITYPSTALSHNWLILSSQLANLRLIVFNKMVDLYVENQKQVAGAIHDLN